jgi:hypothetical protein
VIQPAQKGSSRNRQLKSQHPPIVNRPFGARNPLCLQADRVGLCRPWPAYGMPVKESCVLRRGENKMQNEPQNRKRGAEGGLPTPSLSIPWRDQLNTVTQPGGQEIFNSTEIEKLILSRSEGRGLRAYLSEGIPHLLQSLLLKERVLYLPTNSKEVGTGFCPPRTISQGTAPMDISAPRTRAGFYPPSRPKHRRKLTEPYRPLLRDLLLGTKSFSELGRTVRRLGLPPRGTRRDFTNPGTRRPGIWPTAVGLGLSPGPEGRQGPLRSG